MTCTSNWICVCMRCVRDGENRFRSTLTHWLAAEIDWVPGIWLFRLRFLWLLIFASFLRQHLSGSGWENNFGDGTVLRVGSHRSKSIRLENGSLAVWRSIITLHNAAHRPVTHAHNAHITITQIHITLYALMTGERTEIDHEVLGAMQCERVWEGEREMNEEIGHEKSFGSTQFNTHWLHIFLFFFAFTLFNSI